MFQPVTGDSRLVYRRVVEQIQERIASGELQPGDRLPSEVDLAQKLNVGRTTLREGLRGLASAGLLEIQHGRGVFVAQEGLEASLARLRADLTADHRRWRELVEVRMALEPVAAMLAATRGAAAEKQQIFAIAAGYRAEVAKPIIDREQAQQWDMQFHEALIRCAGNHVLLRVMHSIYDLLGEGRLRSTSVHGRLEASVVEHEEILAAVMAGDGAQAQQAMMQHLQAVQQAIEALGRNETGEVTA